MITKKRVTITGVLLVFLFAFMTFAGGTPQNEAVATRNVTFIDGYNNQEISAQKVVVGEDAEVPEDPKHGSNVFVGWYLENDREKRITNFTNITEDITVIALYGADRNGNGIVDDDEDHYIVRFVDTFDGSVIDAQTILPGMSATAPTVPVHAGRTFVRWSGSYNNVRSDLTINTVWRTTSENEGNNEGNDENEGGNGSVATPNHYYVTFVDSITQQTIVVVEVLEGETATLPTSPRQTGYVFKEWIGNYRNVTKDETVTAMYDVDANGNGIADTLENYKVIYNNRFDGVVGTVEDSNTYMDGETYKILSGKDLSLEDAVFVGWSESMIPLLTKDNYETYKTSILSTTTATMKIGGVTLYAVFAEDKDGDLIPDYDQFTVTYNNRFEGVIGEVKDAKTYVEGTTYKILSGKDLSLEDAIFVGWTKEENIPMLTRDNYDGYKSVIIRETTGVMARENVVFYAVFAEDKDGDLIPDYDQYAIFYDKNMAEGIVPSVDALYKAGEKHTVLEGNLTLENAIFLGWSTEKIALLETTAQYEEHAKDILAVGTEFVIRESDEKNIVLYAVFAKSSDGIKPDYLHDVVFRYFIFDEKLGTVGTATKTIQVFDGKTLSLEVGSDYETEKNFYEFKNWIYETTKEVAKDTDVVTEDLVLEANYNVKATITFVGYKGSKDVLVNVGDAATLADTKDVLPFANHTFIEWDKDVTNVQENMTVHAKYKANVIGMKVSPNKDIVVTSDVTEDTFKNLLTVTAQYKETDYPYVEKENPLTDYELVGFSKKEGRHTVTVKYSNGITAKVEYTVVGGTIASDIANSNFTYQEAGKKHVITKEKKYQDNKWCRRIDAHCDSSLNIADIDNVEINYNFLELEIAHLSKGLSLGTTGKAYYSDNTSATISIKKMNYKFYSKDSNPGYYNMKYIVSGENDTDLLTDLGNKNIQYLEIPYVENGVSHIATFQYVNGTFEIVTK